MTNTFVTPMPSGNRPWLAVALTVALALTFFVAPHAAAQDGPALPEGLDESSDGPSLPAGLDESNDAPPLPGGLDEEPDGPDGLELPAGLVDESTVDAQGEPPTEPAGLIDDVTGFWEVRGGLRTQRDRYQKQASIGETRLQLSIEQLFDAATAKLTVDALYDPVLDRHRPDIENGHGAIDLREGWASFTPVDFADVKLGRQILTWGTGDLIFLNDLFPKDWQAFFIGRDIEYLKAPSDAVKASLFSDAATLDVVFTPRFDADRGITGRRISYYNAMLGRRAGRDAVIRLDRRNQAFEDFELAGRLSKTVEGYELAAYGYHGFWKSPAGMNPITAKATYPRLNVYGASVRGPLGAGIANVEAAYYDSLQDQAGTNPLIDNSEVRLLSGYERDLPEIAKDFTLAGQYYIEVMTHREAYVRSLPPTLPKRDAWRHVLTLRATKRLMNQNLTLSMFAFYSPSDSDAYLRPSVKYKIDDHWSVEAGSNVFFGAFAHTFFSRFRDNTNVYGALRYAF